jgi:hypothetical protein
MGPDKAFGRQGQQLGDGLDVPIGEADLDMAQIGGELWQLSFDIESRSIPLEEPPRRERVPKILKSRPPAQPTS